MLNPNKPYPWQVVLTIGLAFSAISVAAAQTRPNVLFIAIDDLNDWISVLDGHPDVRTPNLERLAERGVVFTNAHCVSPVCGPSRAAVMTGLRPETTGVYTNEGNVHDYVPQAQLLPEAFMSAGYRVLGAGKLIHPTNNVIPRAFHEYGPGTGIVGGPFTAEELASRNMPPQYAVDRGKGELKAILPLNRLPIDRPANELSTFDWGAVDVTDMEMPDGQIADWAIRKMAERQDVPLFLGIGFYRPHQPLFTPLRYQQLYSADQVTLPPTLPRDLDDVGEVARFFALSTWTSGRHDTVVRYGKWSEAVASYLACITFVDSLLGKVLDAFDQSVYSGNTFIVVWSDHGWHLGEKQHWGKWTPWERSTRSPLIIVPPKAPAWSDYARGKRCHRTVTLLDLYPTLMDLCSIRTSVALEGNSLAPLLRIVDAKWDKAAVTTFGRGNHSVRTEPWRYIRYFDGSEELYDRESDPYEWHNLAMLPQFVAIKRKMAKHITTDKRFGHFVRMGSFKAIVPTGGKPTMLFDLKTSAGIAEEQDIASLHPEIVANITSHLRRNNIDSLNVVIDPRKRD